MEKIKEMKVVSAYQLVEMAIILLGAPENSESISLYNQGSVRRVYNWDGNNWNLVGSEINGESIANIKLGYSLDINDDGSRLS